MDYDPWLDSEGPDLANQAAYLRRQQRELFRHPDPRDPDYPIDEYEDE